MSTLDNSVANVALPSIGRSLHAGAEQSQWVVDGYIVPRGALLLEFLIGARALQATGGCFLVPSSLALVSDAYPDPSDLVGFSANAAMPRHRRGEAGAS